LTSTISEQSFEYTAVIMLGKL